MANLKTTKGLTGIQSKAVTVLLVSFAVKVVFEVLVSTFMLVLTVLSLL